MFNCVDEYNELDKSFIASFPKDFGLRDGAVYLRFLAAILARSASRCTAKSSATCIFSLTPAGGVKHTSPVTELCHTGLQVTCKEHEAQESRQCRKSSSARA